MICMIVEYMAVVPACIHACMALTHCTALLYIHSTHSGLAVEPNNNNNDNNSEKDRDTIFGLATQEGNADTTSSSGGATRRRVITMVREQCMHA